LANSSSGSVKNIHHLLERTPHKAKLLKGNCTNPTYVQKSPKKRWSSLPSRRKPRSTPGTKQPQNMLQTKRLRHLHPTSTTQKQPNSTHNSIRLHINSLRRNWKKAEV